MVDNRNLGTQDREAMMGMTPEEVLRALESGPPNAAQWRQQFAEDRGALLRRRLLGLMTVAEYDTAMALLIREFAAEGKLRGRTPTKRELKPPTVRNILRMSAEISAERAEEFVPDPRCVAEWNPGVWPYAKRCESVARVGDFCEMHAQK